MIQYKQLDLFDRGFGITHSRPVSNSLSNQFRSGALTMLINQETKKELVLLEDLGMMYATSNSSQKSKFGLYKCYCGNEFKARVADIKNNNTKSCGCYNKEVLSKRVKTHGLIKHRLYDTWNNMMARCNNKNNTAYENYGGRGITVCERWLDVKNFIDDMYPTFQDGLTLDRIDSNGNYDPTNCRWATNAVQQRNTRLIYKHNKSGYRGVSKKGNSFVAQICVDSKRIYIGAFKTSLDAAKAYDKYVIDNNLEHNINGVL